MRQESSNQNSFSSHTSPGLTSRVSRTGCPWRSRQARSTGCRKPIHCARAVSCDIRSCRSGACPIGSTQSANQADSFQVGVSATWQPILSGSVSTSSQLKPSGLVHTGL